MSRFNLSTSFSKKKKLNKIEYNENQTQEIKSNFIQGLTDKQEKFKQDTDMEVFICVAFQNRAQKEYFLKEMGWDALGDKYLSGIQVAEKQGIKLQIDNNMRKKFKFKTINNTL